MLPPQGWISFSLPACGEYRKLPLSKIKFLNWRNIGNKIRIQQKPIKRLNRDGIEILMKLFEIINSTLPIVVNTVQANNHESDKLHSGLDDSNTKFFSYESSRPLACSDHTPNSKFLWFQSSLRSCSLEFSRSLLAMEAPVCASNFLKTHAPNRPYRIKIETSIAFYKMCVLISAMLFMLLF